MTHDQYAAVASVAVGIAAQWLLFGPKKVPTLWAWVAVVAFSVLAYVYATPDLGTTPWRDSIFKFGLFLSSTKGWGAIAKAAGFAPATDSI